MNNIEYDDTQEKEPGLEWVAELLQKFYSASTPQPEDLEFPEIPISARLTERWRQSALAAEYLIAMQESAAKKLDLLSHTAFTQFVKAVAVEAQVADMGSVWQWIKLTPNARLDIASAHGYGELALALRLPLEETLSSVQIELAEQWGVDTRQPAPVLVEHRTAEARQVSGARSRGSVALFSALEYAKQPFQLMDLQLILSEVRSAYCVFE